MRCNGCSCRLERVQPCSTYSIFFAGFRDVLLFAQGFHSSSFCIVVLQKFENKHKTIENSVNSISSMPSPVYQWRNALRRNMAVNCSATRFHVSWTAVVLPMNVVAILRPFGGMSQMADLTLFGIHSTKYDEF